ncbi:MAG: ABC transporter ATP-binding protein [Hoeflea sp.]|uniref:ABC transporter ATP-binding protein n=1 Tax=Hoeflea sp. TaxID=1940281 RepID=UPI003299464D
MLSLSNISASYGASRVLFDISLELREGEVVTLMGRNGMGKTTTIRCIMGLLAPTGGEIRFQNQQISGWVPEKIARLGAGLVPEGRQIFATLTVRENLVATAANRSQRANPWTLERIYQLFPRLKERHAQSAGTLSGGEQQMLAVGRALMTNPSLLILDEATEGLAPVIRTEIWHVIEKLKAEGQSILLIDKNLAVLKRLADRHYIIERGRTVWSGGAAELERDAPQVQAYVGV